MIDRLLPRILAHGIGGVQDLPVPKWLFFWGGAFVLVVSFILLGALWKTPQLEQHEDGRDLGESFGRLVLGPVRIVIQALSAFLFVVIRQNRLTEFPEAGSSLRQIRLMAAWQPFPAPDESLAPVVPCDGDWANHG